MNLAGFCRNCLSNWYQEAAAERGLALSKDEARQIVYGMPYTEWQQRYQSEASPEAQAAFAKSGHWAQAIRPRWRCYLHAAGAAQNTSGSFCQLALKRRATAPSSVVCSLDDRDARETGSRHDDASGLGAEAAASDRRAASSGSRKRRRHSPATSATSISRPRASASM